MMSQRDSETARQNDYDRKRYSRESRDVHARWRFAPMSDSNLKHQLKIITIPVFIEIALVMLLGAVDTVILLRRWRSGKWRSKGFVGKAAAG